MNDAEGPQTEWTFALVDVAGFTALTERHGDEHAAKLATVFADLAARQLDEGDRLVKTLGDAVLLAASSPPAGSCTGFEAPELRAAGSTAFPSSGPTSTKARAVEWGGDLFGSAVA